MARESVHGVRGGSGVMGITPHLTCGPQPEKLEPDTLAPGLLLYYYTTLLPYGPSHRNATAHVIISSHLCCEPTHWLMSGRLVGWPAIWPFNWRAVIKNY